LTYKPWKIEAVLQMLLGLFGGVALAGFLAAGLGYKPVSGQIDPVMMIVSAVSFHGVGLLWLHWLVREHQLSWRTALGLGGRTLPGSVTAGVIVGVAAFFICQVVGSWVYEILSRFQMRPELQPTVKALQTTVSPTWAALFAVISIVLAPLVEEFIFRGIIYPLLKQLGLPVLAWVGTSLLFAASHVNLQAFVPLTLLALMLTWLYERTDTLIAPIFAHATFNAINFALTIHYGALSTAGAGP
jgi:membrane protease YdiL (CAAX protease family)